MIYPTVKQFIDFSDEQSKLDLFITRQIDYRSYKPTYAIIDSQSVKTVDTSEGRGIDGGKKL